MYLLDTNACIQFLRDPDSTVARRLAAVPAGEVALCTVVKAELTMEQGAVQTPIARYGCWRRSLVVLPDGATLVTHNTREFARVPDLQIKDWEAVRS